MADYLVECGVSRSCLSSDIVFTAAISDSSILAVAACDALDNSQPFTFTRTNATGERVYWAHVGGDGDCRTCSG